MYKHMPIFNRSYCSTSWPYANDNFSSVMSSWHFELLMRFLHLNNSETQPRRGDPAFDKLYKVRPFLDIIVKRHYQPLQHFSIDESMISFKGRLCFIQYLPKNLHKWGLKAWVLADSTSDYTRAWKLYTGKEEGLVEHGLANRVAMSLVNDDQLKHKGYIVYMNNFYSSPALFKDLTNLGFAACGTARKDRRGIPRAVTFANLRKGEVCSRREEGVLSLSLVPGRTKQTC